MGRFESLEGSRFHTRTNFQNVRNSAGADGNVLTVPDDAVRKIGRILADTNLVGAAVSGPAGNGRRATVELGCALLPETPQIVRLNGSAFAARMPMGVLAFLLAKLEIGPEANRHELVHSLGRLLCPDGVASVVVLGRPELIDDDSSSLLAQLATMNRIKLVVICELVHDLPRDILALFRSGKLEQVAVNRQDSAKTRAFLEAELGGRISVLAVASLQHLADGNRGLMVRLARIWISEEQMVHKSGVWVLRTTELVNGPAVRLLLNSMVSGLDDEERALLYALALGGSVSIESVHRAGLTLSMDGLVAKGHVSHVRQTLNRVMITLPLLRILLRLQTDAEMMLRVEELLPALHMDPRASQTYTQMRALAELGQNNEIIAIGETYEYGGYSSASWLVEPYLKAKVLKLHVKALVYVGDIDHAEALIARAASGLQSALETNKSREKLLRASQELELLDRYIKLNIQQPGRGSEEATDQEQLLHDTQWVTEGLHIRALSLEASNLAVQARHDDAQQMFSRITRELQTLSLNGVHEEALCLEDQAEIQRMLLHSALLAGDRTRALVHALELATGKFEHPRLIAHAEMICGILFGLQGEPERALQILEPCLYQLELLDQENDRVAVEAVVAHAKLSLDLRGEGTELLLPRVEEELATTAINFQSWVAEIFNSLSLALFDSVEIGKARLLDYAKNAGGARCTALELHSLAFALRLGHWDSADKLESLAAASQGHVVSSYQDLAHSVRSDMSQALAPLEHLAASGFTILATTTNNALIECMDTRDQRKLAKQLGLLKRPLQITRQGTDKENPESQPPTLGWARELTKRESQIACMAISGKSNQEIARFNGVSIRTVEGHLYQVYAKLQVRNRQELTAMERASRRVVGQR